MNNIDPCRILSGEWRFTSSTNLLVLIAIARELAASKDGVNFLDIYIRSASNEEYCIGFKYLMKDVAERTRERFFHKMREKLKRRFGDQLKGWSISHSTLLIKMVGV